MGTNMVYNIGVLIVLIILSGIFSGSETAFVSLSKSKVEELASKHKRKGRYLKKLKDDTHKLLITILIGNNVVNIGASAFASYVFTIAFGSTGIGIAVGVMTLLIITFGEIMPKTYAHRHAAKIALTLAHPFYILQKIITPLIWFFDIIAKLIRTDAEPSVTEDELRAFVKVGAEEGAIETHEREFIENILEFNDLCVKEVMTHRVVMEAIEINMTLQEAVDYAIKHSHSRLPVYKGTIDNIVGLVSIKELLKFMEEYRDDKKLSRLKLQKPLKVPGSMQIHDLFRKFKKSRSHLAIVIDDQGGTAGLVTLEDLLEEIVGEIIDESDIEILPIEQISDKEILARGSTRISEINRALKIRLGSDSGQTVNSYILDKLHVFPREGEVIKFKSAKITILKMFKHRIEQVKVAKL
ncbi:MAG: hemolysin family protein [Patescibacteria group bacterium]